MQKNKTKILAIKDNGKVRYISKSVAQENDNGIILKSYINNLYGIKSTQQLIVNNPNITVEVIEEVPANEWYDKKLSHVVDKYSKGNDLLNADWMKEGKRGYWEGKKRDKHTLNRLSESKQKRLLQYDENGKLVKIWDSIKDVAINVFKDYTVTNGGSSSTLYSLLSANQIKTRFAHNNYWIKEDEFNFIPKKINIDAISKKQLEDKRRRIKETRLKNGVKAVRAIKPIYVCDINWKVIKEYPSIIDASEALNIHPSRISCFCRYLKTKPINGYTFKFKKIKHRQKYIDRINGAAQKGEKLL